MNDTVEERFDVCVVGLGYVGLTLATAFAATGMRVAGTERRGEILAALGRGEATFYEAGLSEALREVVAEGRLTAIAADSPLPRASSYVITVGTPLEDGRVQQEDLARALESVAAGMPAGALVVLRSTVRLGSTSDLAAATLAASGKEFLLAMAPERTVEGKAMAELTTLPQIIGGRDEASLAAASDLFGTLGVEIVPVASPKEAEFAKLVSNTWRDLQFAFANELAYVADLAGVDVYRVIEAAGHNYDRLNLALPGPVAGPCLEKDAYILADSAAHYGASAPLSRTARAVNEHIVGHIGDLAARLRPSPPGRVAILGLAFKGRPATSDVRGSLAGAFAKEFSRRWPAAEVLGWDPVVAEAEAATLPLTPATLAQAARAEVVLLQTNHPDFSSRALQETLLAHLPAGALVVDLWNQTGPLAEARPDLQVEVFGRAPRMED